MQILDLQLKKGQYQLDDEARAAVRDYIVTANTGSIAFGNARGVRNIFERLLVAQANRLSTEEAPDRDRLMTITAADVQAARESDDKLNKTLQEREAHEEAARQAADQLDALAAELKKHQNA